MSYTPGDTVTGSFPVSDATGAAANGTGMVARMVKENTVDGAVTVTLGNPATGNYTFLATIPGTYALGDRVRIEVQGTVAGVALPWTMVWQTRLDSTVAGVAVQATAAADFAEANNNMLGTLVNDVVTAMQGAGTYLKSLYDGLSGRYSLLDNLSRLDATITSLPSAANIAVSVWNYLTASATTPGSFGKLLKDNINVALNTLLPSSYGQTITQIHNASKTLPHALGILAYVGFFAREEAGTPNENQLVVEELEGLPIAVGQYLVLGLQLYNPPGVPAGLIWQVTAVADALVTLMPVGHTTTVQAWLGESAASQGITLTANSPLLAAVRVNKAIPDFPPNHINGLPLRNFFNAIQSAADAFVGLISGGRYTAFALSLAPVGEGGVPAPATGEQVILALVGDPPAAGCGCSSGCGCSGGCGSCSTPKPGEFTQTHGDTATHPIRLVDAGTGNWLNWEPGYTIELWSDVESLGEADVTVTDSSNLYARWAIGAPLWADVPESGGLYFLKVMDGVEELAVVNLFIAAEDA